MAGSTELQPLNVWRCPGRVKEDDDDELHNDRSQLHNYRRQLHLWSGWDMEASVTAVFFSQ